MAIFDGFGCSSLLAGAHHATMWATATTYEVWRFLCSAGTGLVARACHQ